MTSELSRTSESGGYDVGDTTVYRGQAPLARSELDSLSCSKCKLILREPKQVIVCGHRYCKPCIEQLTTGRDGPFTCCLDSVKFQMNEVRNDRGCLKEIQALEVDCPTRPDPCTWRGPLMSEMEQHMEQCPHRTFPCSQGCGKHCMKEDLNAHMSKECPRRLSTCKYCKTKHPNNMLKEHYQSCQQYPVKCEYCMTSLHERRELPHHYENCSEYCMTCPYSGCQFEGKKLAVTQHAFTSHFIQQMERIRQMEEEMRTIKSENQKLHSEVSELTSHVSELRKSNDEKDGTIKQLNATVGMATKSQHGDAVEIDSASTKRAVLSSADKHSARPDKDNSMRGEMDTYQAQLQHVSESIQTIQNSLTQYAIAIDELRLRQDVLDVKTTNGTFIWKIPDIRRRYRDAVDGKTVSLYSPPFYTSPHGYRVCIRIYLNGDGIGKGTHISMFFFIMRSEHDNLLSWPFKQSVRFTLINQKNPAASITEAFAPDLQSPSFQKPEYDMNIASGFPKFARQSVLQDDNFTQDNFIFVKCQIDLTGLRFQ